MKELTYGSVCSGIESASAAWPGRASARPG